MTRQSVETVELAVPQPEPIVADARRTLAVFVDLENEFLDPRGLRYLGPETEPVLANAVRFLDAVRVAGAKVLWIRSVRAPDEIEITAFGNPIRLLEGTWAVEFTPPLRERNGEKVVTKRSHDCFANTDLDEWLATEGITAPSWQIVVCGVSLHTCVNHAVLGFSVRSFPVAVVRDCVHPNTGPAAVATLWRYGTLGYAWNIAVTESSAVHWHRSEQT